MVAYRQSLVWHSFGILDFNERIYIFFGEYHFYNASFLVGMMHTYAVLQTITFWALVWDSVFQRTHIQMLGESYLYNAFWGGDAKKYAGLQKITFWTSV